MDPTGKPDRDALLYVNILAHGEAERWERIAKLSVKYNGCGVLLRTICLAEAYFPHDFVKHVVWAWPDVQQLCSPKVILAHPGVRPKGKDRITAYSLWPADRETLLHSMRHITEQGFIGRQCTLWLLGDVAYSSHLMARIRIATNKASASSNDEIIFIGRFQPNLVSAKEASELFGVIVPSTAHSEFMYLVTTALERYRTRKSVTARLWDLYDVHHADDDSLIEIGAEGSLTAPVIASDDYSDDIDSRMEFNEFYTRMSHAAHRDTDIARIIKRTLSVAAGDDRSS